MKKKIPNKLFYFVASIIGFRYPIGGGHKFQPWVEIDICLKDVTTLESNGWKSISLQLDYKQMANYFQQSFGSTHCASFKSTDLHR